MTREEFITAYQITSRRGRLYGRAELRSYVRSKVGAYPADGLRRMLDLIDNHAWMQFRRGQTPSSILQDALREVYGP